LQKDDLSIKRECSGDFPPQMGKKVFLFIRMRNRQKTAGRGQQVLLSALLTTTMTAMESTINAIREAGLRNKVKIMIGGAPVSQNFSDKQELMVKVITQMVR